MALLSSIVKFLDEELKINAIQDLSLNGLQIGDLNHEVTKIAFAVDASLETFERAEGHDLLIVHHGLLWNKPIKFVEREFKRIEFLIHHNMAVYAAHLPLDYHEYYGNNTQLAQFLDIKKPKPFVESGGALHLFNKTREEPIGVYGKIKEQDVNEFVKDVEKKLKTVVRADLFGSTLVRTVGVVTGSGAYELVHCQRLGIDTFITGEPRHSMYHVAKELKLNVIYAGHYVTETFGVKALMPVLKKKFEVEVTFVDVPTGL